MKNRLLLLFILLSSCSENDKDWKGGAIAKVGRYQNSDYTINVYNSNGSLKYNMLNSHGDTLAQEHESISMFHKWGLHLDSNGNLWVFSSDVGDSCWKQDSLVGEYIKHKFYGLLDKDSIASEVYETLSKFHPYSSMKEK